VDSAILASIANFDFSLVPVQNRWDNSRAASNRGPRAPGAHPGLVNTAALLATNVPRFGEVRRQNGRRLCRIRGYPVSSNAICRFAMTSYFEAAAAT
jgi:hypothetical protein